MSANPMLLAGMVAIGLGGAAFVFLGGDSLAKRRLAFSRLRDVSVVEKLFLDLGPRFKARAGGYTRILKMEPRPGDSADMALMQLVEAAVVPAAKTEEPKASKASSLQGLPAGKTKAAERAAVPAWQTAPSGAE